ncbi:hypothetical protein Y032_0155g3048 [Ancylostoma ceylanicum]|uniref:Uncharacterized protein n=1 Tax=Ancylostoma ceylanicum TaxID=53326 RepID=A0A016SZM4_9BILA|nr:hypothetical protein Y032_0155g3048 [Ancylostoma ceylanicum]
MKKYDGHGEKSESFSFSCAHCLNWLMSAHKATNGKYSELSTVVDRSRTAARALWLSAAPLEVQHSTTKIDTFNGLISIHRDWHI